MWIETKVLAIQSVLRGHTLRGCVDWNISHAIHNSRLSSHTLRGCVDWNNSLSNSGTVVRVTPCVGVWIETSQGVLVNTSGGHTLRGCVDWNNSVVSMELLSLVTPCVGVWIETSISLWFWSWQLSHPAWVCGLKQLNGGKAMQTWVSHTLRGCVDWNSQYPFPQNFYHSHTLRGCVDWNHHGNTNIKWYKVTPCVGVWIETEVASVTAAVTVSHPAWVCGLKHGIAYNKKW